MKLKINTCRLIIIILLFNIFLVLLGHDANQYELAMILTKFGLLPHVNYNIFIMTLDIGNIAAYYKL